MTIFGDILIDSPKFPEPNEDWQTHKNVPKKPPEQVCDDNSDEDISRILNYVNDNNTSLMR